MLRVTIASVLVIVSSAALAAEDPPPLCYEVVGCVQDRKILARDAEKLGCDQLWTVRNGIFAIRGYCFQAQRGIDEFGNTGCRYTDQSEVPLNDYERANVGLIQSIEKKRGC